MQVEDQAALVALIRGQRQAALGTLADGTPYVSMVLYAIDTGPGDYTDAPLQFLIHVSRLSPHTSHLEADPRVSLLIAQPDNSEGDPQQLPRVTIQAMAQRLDRESQEYEQGKAVYVARLPMSEFLFTFTDFSLYRLVPTEARYIGGFAKAFSLTAEQLQQAMVVG